ncbi:MAG TPA: gliding motility protein GldN [Hanamia sp.]|jgi:gliding motility associated protien GldN|nr:gliding motility protein GldN [Hanamia sp.]
MKTMIMKCLVVVLALGVLSNTADAQARKRTAKKRTTAKKTTAAKTNANIHPAATDTAIVQAPAPVNDSLPITSVKPSLRPETALDVHNGLVTERVPLPYQVLRQEDAAYDERIWREIDTREKINLPFRYSANEDNGNQRFISILFKAIQDGPDNGGVTAFAPVDDRFTTPMTKAEVAKAVSGGSVSVPIYDSLGNVIGNKETMQEVNLDSFYKFQIKEEVIFDKQSSRLFWRILGIAPIKRVITSSGVDLGDTPLFWVYYPDMRPIFAKYYVYNGKNYGARMTWEDLFESRMFHGRIIKSTLNNPFDQFLSTQMGLKQSSILQLLQGDKIQNEIFDYEQNLWSY